MGETLREIVAEELLRIDDEELEFVTITGIEVDKRMVNLTSSIKDLGVYQVNVKLTQGVTASIKVDVRADEAESDEEIEAIEEATAEYVEAHGDEAPPELIPEPGTDDVEG